MKKEIDWVKFNKLNNSIYSETRNIAAVLSTLMLLCIIFLCFRETDLFVILAIMFGVSAIVVILRYFVRSAVLYRKCRGK